MQAPHRKLNNLTAIIDRNRLQIDGCTESVKALDNLQEKLRLLTGMLLKLTVIIFKKFI